MFIFSQAVNISIFFKIKSTLSEERITKYASEFSIFKSSNNSSISSSFIFCWDSSHDNALADSFFSCSFISLTKFFISSSLKETFHAGYQSNFVNSFSANILSLSFFSKYEYISKLFSEDILNKFEYSSVFIVNHLSLNQFTISVIIATYSFWFDSIEKSNSLK